MSKPSDSLTPALRTAVTMTIISMAVIAMVLIWGTEWRFGPELFGLGMFGALGSLMMFFGYGIIRSYQRSIERRDYEDS